MRLSSVHCPLSLRISTLAGLVIPIPPVRCVVHEQTVVAIITNHGSLPARDVTVTVATEDTKGHLPPYTIELSPAADREVVTEGSNVVVRLKNPLGPKKSIEAQIKFTTATTLQPSKTKEFTVGEAFVDSEVGAATLVPSFGGGGSTSY